MAQDLSIMEAFGEIRSLKQRLSDEWGELILTDPYPSFLAAIRTKDYLAAAALHSRVITCNINLLTRTRGSDEEITTVLLPYQLAFLKSMSDPFQAEFREKIQVKYNNSYLVKDRLKSLHELRIHYFSCSRGMLLVQQEVSASLPNLTVLDVRGDYLYRDDIRARFSLSPDCEILL